MRTPLPDRCWDLFCQGHSFSAIGRALGINRETAARHVQAIHQQVQADRRADRALALSRALGVGVVRSRGSAGSRWGCVA